MMGRVYTCSKCDFDFSSGWSHHEAGQLLTCKHCAVLFVLGGGASLFDPREKDILRLRQASDRDAWYDLAREITIVRLRNREEWDGVVELKFDGIACPCCLLPNALVQSLADGDACPNCKEGVVSDGGYCIY